MRKGQNGTCLPDFSLGDEVIFGPTNWVNESRKRSMHVLVKVSIGNRNNAQAVQLEDSLIPKLFTKTVEGYRNHEEYGGSSEN